MILAASRVQTKAPRRLTARTLSKSSSFMRTRNPSLVMPALLTSTAKSTLSLISAAKKSATGRAVAHIEGEGTGPASGRRDFGHGLFRLFGAAHIGKKNLKAVAGKGLGDGPADAARTAGHQGRGERLCGGRRGLRCVHAGSAFAVGTWNAVYSSDTGEFQCARAPVSGVARHGMR